MAACTANFAAVPKQEKEPIFLKFMELPLENASG
jgi:hypothetical protein